MRRLVDKIAKTVALFAMIQIPAMVQAVDIYVSTMGNDSADGSREMSIIMNL